MYPTLTRSAGPTNARHCLKNFAEWWGTSTELYFRVDKLLNQLANPNLHNILPNLQIHVELWDRYDKHIRWVIAATSSIVIGVAAFDVAVSMHPQERADRVFV